MRQYTAEETSCAHIDASNDGLSKRTRSIGKAAERDSSLQTAGEVIRKSFFCVSNVAVKFDVEDVSNYIESVFNVKPISCFDCTPKDKPKNPIGNTYRICIKIEDKGLFLDPSKWPINVVVREWVFKAKPKDGGNVDKSQTTNSALASNNGDSVSMAVDNADIPAMSATAY